MGLSNSTSLHQDNQLINVDISVSGRQTLITSNDNDDIKQQSNTNQLNDNNGVVTVNPNDVIERSKVFNQLFSDALALYNKGNINSAMNNFKICYEIDVTSQRHLMSDINNGLKSSLYVIIGDQLLDDGRYEEALNQYRSSQLIDPSCIYYIFNECKCLLAIKRYDDCIKCLEKAIKIVDTSKDKLSVHQQNKQYFEIYLRMQIVEEKRNNITQSILYCKKALSFYHDSSVYSKMYNMQLELNAKFLPHGKMFKNDKISKDEISANLICRGPVIEYSFDENQEHKLIWIMLNAKYFTTINRDLDPIDIIPIDKITKVTCSDYGHENKEYEYGIQLHFYDEFILMFAVNSRNLRDSFVCHLQQLLISNTINHNVDNNNMEDKTEENDDIIKIISDEWKTTISDSDMKDMNDKDICESADQCCCLNRILSISKCFSLWVHCKLKRKTFMEIMNEILSYNSTDLINDYHHCMTYHDKYVSTTVNVMNDKCDMKQCDMFSRNYRNRCTSKESNNRSKLYYNIENVQDIVLLQALDTIHCYLYHTNDENGFNRIQNKFVTHINDEKSNEIENKHSETESENKDHTTHSNDIVSTYQYAFGTVMNYWDLNQNNFVDSRYISLKEELLHNKIETVSLQQFSELYLKALLFIHSDEIKQIKANDNSIYSNDELTICDSLTINHIIVLLSYSNYDNLQYLFKQHCRKFKGTESDESVCQRNTDIANWCRYLYESVHIYGQDINQNEHYYHGLNCTLLFDSIKAIFNIPLSTTIDFSIAHRFTNNNENGMILQLSKYRSVKSYNFNISLISDFNERERLFFYSALLINNIIINKNIDINMNLYKPYTNSLLLFNTLIQGNCMDNKFSADVYYKSLQQQYEEIIIKFIEYVMHPSDNNNEMNDTYPFELFKHQLKHLKKVDLWINLQMLQKLKSKLLREYLYNFETDNVGSFINYLMKEYDIFTPGFVRHYTWNILIDSLKDLKENESMKRPSMCGSTIHRWSGREKIIFNFHCEKQLLNDEYWCYVVFVLYSSEQSKDIPAINIEFEVVCNEINLHKMFDKYTLYMEDGKNYLGDYLFPIKPCDNLETIELSIFVKVSAFEIPNTITIINQQIPYKY